MNSAQLFPPFPKWISDSAAAAGQPNRVALHRSSRFGFEGDCSLSVYNVHSWCVDCEGSEVCGVCRHGELPEDREDRRGHLRRRVQGQGQAHRPVRRPQEDPARNVSRDSFPRSPGARPPSFKILRISLGPKSLSLAFSFVATSAVLLGPICLQRLQIPPLPGFHHWQSARRRRRPDRDRLLVRRRRRPRGQPRPTLFILLPSAEY